MSQDTIKVDSSFGKKVYDLRKKKNWGQYPLADEAGVSQRTISRIESIKEGKSQRFDRKILQKIAKALGTTLETLLEMTDAPPPPLDWESAYEEVRKCLENHISVNLVVPVDSPWRKLIQRIGDKFGDLGTVDLYNPATANRKGLVTEILTALGITSEIPKEPEGEDLIILNRKLRERDLSRLALLHFDVVPARLDYDYNLFGGLRFLIMDSRQLVLLVQSNKPFKKLVPTDHPFSHIILRTVEPKPLNSE